jgi:hypothetical protein
MITYNKKKLTIMLYLYDDDINENISDIMVDETNKIIIDISPFNRIDQKVPFYLDISDNNSHFIDLLKNISSRKTNISILVNHFFFRSDTNAITYDRESNLLIKLLDVLNCKEINIKIEGHLNDENCVAFSNFLNNFAIKKLSINLCQNYNLIKCSDIFYNRVSKISCNNPMSYNFILTHSNFIDFISRFNNLDSIKFKNIWFSSISNSKIIKYSKKIITDKVTSLTLINSSVLLFASYSTNTNNLTKLHIDNDICCNTYIDDYCDNTNTIIKSIIINSTCLKKFYITDHNMLAFDSEIINKITSCISINKLFINNKLLPNDSDRIKILSNKHLSEYKCITTEMDPTHFSNIINLQTCAIDNIIINVDSCDENMFDLLTVLTTISKTNNTKSFSYICKKYYYACSSPVLRHASSADGVIYRILETVSNSQLENLTIVSPKFIVDINMFIDLFKFNVALRKFIVSSPALFFKAIANDSVIDDFFKFNYSLIQTNLVYNKKIQSYLNRNIAIYKKLRFKKTKVII